MNGWCMLLVCLGVALVQVEGKLDPFIIEKNVAFFHGADRDGDGKLVFDDYHLISQYVLTIPDYKKYNASYLLDVVTNNSWNAFPGKEMNLTDFLKAVEETDPTAMKSAVDGLSKNMYEVWNYREPEIMYGARDYSKRYNCLSADEIEWELKNLGKCNNVKDQAQKAFKAMDKNPCDYCVSLSEYQETAYNYLTSTDLDDDSKYFFGYLGEC